MATGALTLDLTKMTDVRLLRSGFATVQAGADVGKVLHDLLLQSNGTRGFTAGQRPVVGISGFILGEWDAEYCSSAVVITCVCRV